MKKCKTDLLIAEINALNGDCQYPQIGHLRYANIAGDGRRYRTVYCIVNANGGVRAAHNGATVHATIKNLETIRDFFINRPSAQKVQS